MASGMLVVDGVSYPELMVAGDFAFDGDCCPSFEVERTWTATDCSGNTTEAIQLISFEHADTSGNINKPIAISELKANSDRFISTTSSISMSRIAPNPTSSFASFNLRLNKPSNVLIDIVD